LFQDSMNYLKHFLDLTTASTVHSCSTLLDPFFGSCRLESK
jgi:hypothetical protein